MWSNPLFIMGFFGALSMAIVAGALLLVMLLVRPDSD
jgi:hypothetical protein